MNTKRTLKAAIVGLRHGHVGTFGPEKPGYIQTFRHLDGVEVVAYCEETEASLLEPAKQYHPGARLYTSIDDLIANEDFDLACVAMPAVDVPQACIKLAEAGRHMYVEKQFARRASDMVEVVRVVGRTGVKTMAGYPWRFHPAVQEIKGYIDQGVLGNPLSIEARVGAGQVPDPKRFMYTDSEEGGGVLHMLGGHYLEAMRFLMGCEVKSVQAMTGAPVGLIEEGLEEVAFCVFEYENGTYGSLNIGYVINPSTGRGYDGVLVYRGTDGWASWGPWAPEGAVQVEVRSASTEWSDSPHKTLELEQEPTPTPGYFAARWGFDWLQGFIYDVIEDRAPSLTLEDGLYMLQLIDACYESAKTGRRVEVKYGV